jgi:hypothetical protein
MLAGDRLGDPDLTAALVETLTLWATPGVLPAGPDRAGAEVLGLLTLVPAVLVQTCDGYPGAELVDVVVTALLAAGFAMLARPTPAELVALPTPPGWTAVLAEDDSRLHITEPAGSFFDGDVGPAPPTGWHTALEARRELFVLFGTAGGAGAWDAGGAVGGRGAASLVGARVPLAIAPARHQPWPRSR